MITPTIHMNGTSAKMLEEDYRKAHDLLQDFRDAFCKVEFHARDYYVQGDNAFSQARKEREEILAKIKEIDDYLMAIRLSVQEQESKRNRRG